MKLSQAPLIAATMLTLALVSIGMAFALRPNPTGGGILTQAAATGAQTPVTCDAGQMLAWNVSGGALGCLQQASAVFQAGAAASRPSATGSGNLYQCTDIPVLYRDVGAGTWSGSLSNYLAPPPAASSYIAVGSIAVAQTADAVVAVNTKGGTPGVAVVPGSLGQTAQWSVTLHAVPLFQYSSAFPDLAAIVSNGTTNAVSISFNDAMYSNPGIGIHITQDVIGTTTRNAIYTEGSNTIQWSGGTGGVRFRILNDGTCMHMQNSPDGYSYQTTYCIASPSGLTDYGVWLGAEGGANTLGWMQAVILQQALTALTPLTVTAATGNGVTPVVVTVASTAGYGVGDYVSVHGMVGNTSANTQVNQATLQQTARLITGIGPTTISFNEITGNGTWTSGGSILLVSR